MLNKKSTVNKTSKSLLAKCMATEDIRVEHSNDAETAAFDIENRCLILPVWKDMSNSMYDMLVAHEVSHALHTPFEEWDEALDGVSNKNAFKQICNVVEDARIERLIKSQYAGIRKDFARAYTELHNTDLFKLKGKNIDDMGLIDRLNLEFKLGLFGLIQVPFSTDEKQYVTRMANTESFSDVVELAKDLLEDWKADQQENGQGDESSGSEDGSSESSGSEDGSSESTESSESSGSEDGSTESSESSGSSESSDSEDGSTESTESSDSEDGSPMNTPNLDDIQRPDDQQDDENGQGDKAGEGSDQSNLDYDDYSNNSGTPSVTQSAYEQGLKDLVDENATKLQYYTLPTSMNLDNIILDYKDVFRIFEDHVVSKKTAVNCAQFEKQRELTKQNTIKFVSSKKPVINHMVSQFQMKQSADADRRTSISTSGVLDTTAMMEYKWSEDIFQTNQVVANGKNHGMVFFLDWSGSMSGIIKDTVEQLIILTEFCNKVNIPFEVYAFSDRNEILPPECYPQYIENTGKTTCPQYNVKENATNQLRPHMFTLINFVSSRMNKKEYKDAINNLYGIITDYWTCPNKFNLGCTPLNEAIIASYDIVPAFQDATGVQIVNTVFLTDGQGHSMGFNSAYYSKPVLHDPVTRKNYYKDDKSLKYFNETNTYLKVLKDRTGCNVIGIFISSSKSVGSLRYSYIESDDMATASKTWKNSNYAVASPSMTAYDECYCIKGNIGSSQTALDNLAKDASYSKIRNAFRKSATGIKTDKIIATKMIEVFASTLQK